MTTGRALRQYFFHLFAILISIGGRSMKAVALISIFWDGKNYSLPLVSWLRDICPTGLRALWLL